MKIHGNQQNQGMRQTIDWVKDSIDAQLNKAKDLGHKPVDQVQNPFEQRLGSDRFARSQHSGLAAGGLEDLAQRATAAKKSRRRGRLTQGLQPDTKTPGASGTVDGPESPRAEGKPDHPKRGQAHGLINPSMVGKPDIIQVPTTNYQSGGRNTPIA